MIMNLRKLTAFTLAETLIVMGIIGIVSALTLPNLNSSTGEKEKVAKVKKIYQNLDEAIGRAHAVYGPVLTWFSSSDSSETKSQIVANRITEFMKISKTCPANNTACFTADKGKALNSGTVTDTPRAYPQVITADGTSISFFYWLYSSGVTIYVDIDGPNKGKFTYGKDLFIFVLDPNKNDELSPLGDDLNSCFKFGNTCAKWVIFNENMDYINADSSGKCKNGTQLSETKTSCK